MGQEKFLEEKSPYRFLHAFEKAEAIYDLTYLFLEKNINPRDRTHDQMLQAARSGKQNIAEGRENGAVSMEMQIRLFGVARGSLHELLNDYLDYMRTRKLEIWDRSHPRMARLRRLTAGNNDTKFYQDLAPKLNNEELCNLLLTIIHQDIAMISSLIEKFKEDFLKEGGIKEQMFRARLNHRNKNKDNNN